MIIEINNDIDVVIRCYECNEVMEIANLTYFNGTVEVEVYKCECTEDDTVGRI